MSRLHSVACKLHLIVSKFLSFGQVLICDMTSLQLVCCSVFSLFEYFPSLFESSRCGSQSNLSVDSLLRVSSTFSSEVFIFFINFTRLIKSDENALCLSCLFAWCWTFASLVD